MNKLHMNLINQEDTEAKHVTNKLFLRGDHVKK